MWDASCYDLKSSLGTKCDTDRFGGLPIRHIPDIRVHHDISRDVKSLHLKYDLPSFSVTKIAQSKAGHLLKAHAN